MKSAFLRRGLLMAALAAATVLSSCETGPTKAEIEAARLAAEAAARVPPPIALNQSVAESAAVYLAFTRDIATIRGGFASADDIQAALRRGSSYEPAQLSRGLVAYASILALQSPEFVSGIRQYAVDATVRQKLVNDIVANPDYASTLPGADAAAGLIFATMGADIQALSDAATSIETDAYTIQNYSDPRRAWATAHIADRLGRLESSKSLSGQALLPSAEEAARLYAAGNAGRGLGYASDRRREGPYPPAIQKALSLAALAALGAAGDNARANTDALQEDPASQMCLTMSKLNLYQCLAASRPSYEDMFCVGRHIVRDLATCTRGAAMPAPIVTVSDPVSTSRTPSIVTAPLTATPIRQTPAPVASPVTSTPAAAPPTPPVQQTPISATQRLNTTPGG